MARRCRRLDPPEHIVGGLQPPQRVGPMLSLQNVSGHNPRDHLVHSQH